MLLPPLISIKMENINIEDSKINQNNSSSSSNALDDSSQKKEKKKNNKSSKSKKNYWWIKVSIITLFLAAFVSYLSEITAESGNIPLLLVVLLLLVFLSIVFDCIGVAITSCDMVPFVSMSSRKIYGAKTALWLKQHSSTVASICNDVIGDIFGIISGTCAAAIVVNIVITYDLTSVQRWIAIVFSSLVSALTIGGKAFMKTVAINKNIKIVMIVSKVLALFSKEERKRKKKDQNKSKKDK